MKGGGRGGASVAGSFFCSALALLGRLHNSYGTDHGEVVARRIGPRRGVREEGVSRSKPRRPATDRVSINSKMIGHTNERFVLLKAAGRAWGGGTRGDGTGKVGGGKGKVGGSERGNCGGRNAAVVSTLPTATYCPAYRNTSPDSR